MPELPEAETIVRGLRPSLTGRRIVRTRVHHADVVDPSPGRLARVLKLRTIERIGRRGKIVVLHLDEDVVLAVALGMTGGLFPLRPRQRHPGVTHPAVRLFLEGGGQLVFNDARRFGRVRAMDRETWRRWSERLGPEPLEPRFTVTWLAAELSRSRTPIRNWLLDQRRVAGVGNIYASEALFRAGVAPERPARSLSPPEVEALHASIIGVLHDAIRSRGTTLRDYRDSQGTGGSFGPLLRVYGRDGEPCRSCGTAIRRVVFGNRSAFYCPSCQAHLESAGRGRP